ncbi:hypothetical protein LguiA_013602 [Lonicera macranthoides]
MGHVEWAQANSYGDVTNMVAETKALMQGLQLCINQGTLQVELEVNSLVLLQIIQNKVHTPWSIAYEIRNIPRLLQGMEVSASHTYKESNQAADFMANFGCNIGKYVIFNKFTLPRRLK